MVGPHHSGVRSVFIATPTANTSAGVLRLADDDVDDGRTSWSTANFAAFDDDDDGWSVEPASDAIPDDQDAWSVTAEDGGADDDPDDEDDLDVCSPDILSVLAPCVAAALRTSSSLPKKPCR